MKLLAYTVTRAETPERCRLLLETLTTGRGTSGLDGWDWHVYTNSTVATEVCQPLVTTGIIQRVLSQPCNVGQHPPTNDAIKHAIDNGYTYLLRIDDDCEFRTRSWLHRMVDASTDFDDKFVISPQVRGLRWQPTQSLPMEYEGVPVKFISGPIGGICRLTPVQVLRDKPYVSDVRLPMGAGDAGGVGNWCMQQPITPMVYLQHVRVRHGKSTDAQEAADPQYFLLHALTQHCPFIPAWRPQ